MTNNIQGNSHKVKSRCHSKNYKPDRSGVIYLKWWKERTYKQDYSTQQGSHSDSMEKSKALQASKS